MMNSLTFNEKSAWVMLIALLIATFVYLFPVLAALIEAGAIVPPLPFAVAFTVVLILVSILGHIIAALSNPSEAVETRDERDRAILHAAGNWSGICLGIGLIMSLLLYIPLQSGDILFHCAFLSLIVASLIDYAIRIIAYRRAG